MLTALKKKVSEPQRTVADLLAEALKLNAQKAAIEKSGLTAQALSDVWAKATLSTRERILEVRKQLEGDGPHLEWLHRDIERWIRLPMLERKALTPPRNLNYGRQAFTRNSPEVLSTLRIFPAEVWAAVALMVGDSNPELWGKFDNMESMLAAKDDVASKLDAVLLEIGRVGAELGDEVAIEEWGSGLVKPVYVCTGGAVNVFPLSDSGARLLLWAETRQTT